MEGNNLMEQYFSRKIIVFLLVASLIVVGIALFFPLPGDNVVKEVPKEAQEPQGESVSNLFEVKDKKELESKKAIPTDIPKEDACNLDGQMVRGGTVSSNTICVNESPPVIPQ